MRKPAKKLSLPVIKTAFGPSAWQMEVGAGAQTQVIVATDRSGGGNGISVSAPARKLLNAYAAIRGMVLHQEAVVWHFPIFTAAKKHANGVQLDFGRDPTHAEVVTLYDSVYRVSGRDDWAPAYVPGIGLRILKLAGPWLDSETGLWRYVDRSGTEHQDKNFDSVDSLAHADGVSNRAFQEQIKEALSRADIGEVSRQAFKSDGEYAKNDWEKNHGDEDYRLRISGSGRSDLQEWVDHELRPRTGRVNQEFSEKYGWGKPKLSPSRAERSERPRTGHEGSPGSPRASRYGTGQPGSVSVTGIHYSQQEQTVLSGAFYGQGLKGAGYARLQRESGNREQFHRIHFYVDEGQGIRLESGVGEHAHRVTLENLYDWTDDPLNLWPEARAAYPDPIDRYNRMEQLIMERGFDGLYAPQAQGSQGVAVLLGKKHAAVPRPAPKVPEPDPILSDPKLPAGRLPGSRWKQLLAGRLEGLEKLDDGERYYKDQVLRAARFSTARFVVDRFTELSARNYPGSGFPPGKSMRS